MAVDPATISVACGRCGRESRVLASFAGQAGRCPRCREVVLVPDAAALAAQAEAAKEVAAAFTFDAPGDAPTSVGLAGDLAAPTAPAPTAPREASPTSATPDDDRRPCRACGQAIRRAALKCRFCGDIADRPCPTCGEQIKATAKKCRFCGEFLDAALRTRRRQEDTGYTLASPRDRFIAWVLDVALRVPCYAAFGLWFYFIAERMDIATIVAASVGCLWYLVHTVVEWSMLARAGQTPGKRWMGIKVLRTDGTPCGFVHGVVLRNWIYALLGNPMFLSILAVVVWIVDGVMIFSDDRRSLRDHLASTRVVLVEPAAK